MTPDDRSKYARIAAWKEFTGHTEAQVDAYLHSIGSGLTQADVNRAISEGRQGLGLAALLNNSLQAGGATLAAAANGEAVAEYSMVVRYQIGSNADEDWRTVTVDVAAGSTFGQAYGSIETAIGRQRASKGYGRYSPGGIPAAPVVVFAVPVFTTG